MSEEKVCFFDVQNFLGSHEECILYLQACFKEDIGDGKLIQKALKDIAEAYGIERLSKKVGMTSSELYCALKENEEIKLSTFLLILNALNISLRAIKPNVKRH